MDSNETLLGLEDLKPDPENPREISHEALVGLRASEKEFGDISGIVWNRRDGRLVCGHQRLRALRQEFGGALCMRDNVIVTPSGDRFPVRIVDWPKEKARAANLAANNPHIAGDFTAGAVAQLEEIEKAFPAYFDAFCFEKLEEDLRALWPQGIDGVIDDTDSIPLPPDEAVTKRGDLWVLGAHRLLCGDSGSVEDLDRLLAGEPVHMVNTDPPYNVRVEPRSNNAIAAGLSSFPGGGHHQRFDQARHPDMAPTTEKLRPKDRPLENDFMSDEEFQGLLLKWFGNISRVLDPGGAFYIWGGYANLGNYPPVLRASKLYFSQALIWVKEHPVLTRKDFMGNHELCFYGWKEGAGHNFYGPPNVPDVWPVKKVNPQSMIHLTEKPVELAARAIEYSSRKGENVLDLFGGSGSTLIAAEQLKRRSFLMEIDELYCDVIVQRFENLTGVKAVRIQDHESSGHQGAH